MRADGLDTATDEKATRGTASSHERVIAVAEIAPKRHGLARSDDALSATRRISMPNLLFIVEHRHFAS
jgi:hypothetical protein